MEENVKKEEKKIKALVTSRVLFISALDKIYLVCLLLTLILLTFANFAGDISSIYYGFWPRVGREIIILVVMTILYFLLNWFYRCAAKTMLCLTKNEVYKEKYIPFKRTEISIPLNKITRVTTHNAFWIIRLIAIHQYGKLPMIFFTWNNQEFKDKLNELITTDKEKIENEYESKNIIGKEKLKFLMYFGIVFGVIICLIGIVRFFNYIFDDARNVAGTYEYENEFIVLNRDGSCNVDDIISETTTDCTWSYDENNNEVNVYYEYSDYSYYYGYYIHSDSMYLEYDSNKNALIYDDEIYTK